MKTGTDRSAAPAAGSQVGRKSRHSARAEAQERALIIQHNLVARLMEVQEEERTAFARELQEDLGQKLAAIQLNMSLLMTGFQDHTQLVARSAVIEELISSSIVTVQRISSELRPVMLDLLGLAAALEWKVQKISKRGGITCKTVIILPEKRVDHTVSTAIFRIVQEALSNVERHSGATHIELNLVERKGWLMLSVRDNGRGLRAEEKNSPLSFGIATMQERAKSLGGKLRIFGSPTQGTALFVRLPLSEKED